MKKFVLLLSFACLPILYAPCAPKHHLRVHRPAHTTMVYICTGPYAKVYHSSPSCRGLNRCSGDVRTIRLKSAQNMGRKACKICY